MLGEIERLHTEKIRRCNLKRIRVQRESRWNCIKPLELNHHFQHSLG